MTRRSSGLLFVALAVSGCGLGALQGPAEPSGPWSLKGEPVSSDQVQSDAGPEHCGWQEAQFLGLSWPPGRPYDDPRRRRLYVKDPKGVLEFAPHTC